MQEAIFEAVHEEPGTISQSGARDESAEEFSGKERMKVLSPLDAAQSRANSTDDFPPNDFSKQKLFEAESMENPAKRTTIFPISFYYRHVKRTVEIRTHGKTSAIIGIMNENVLTVTQITQNIKEIIEGSFPSLTIEGEISNYRPNASGHLYFVLKDDGAQISAVMFKGKAAGLSFQMKDGTKVHATGTLSVYAPQGKYQLVISKMEIAGEGDILKMIEERKRRLAEEGLFDQQRKKPLPKYPRRVGVVTSPTGAAIRDILNIAKRRNSGISVAVLPAQVQGDTAAKTIAKQIRTANAFRICDVLIVGRGGGSLEDLLPFSDEEVVRAIAESKIPVVSAVGHEIDWALSDYAADMRAPTPSAAAELVFPQKSDIAEEIESHKTAMRERLELLIRDAKMELRTFDTDSMQIRLKSIIQPMRNTIENSKRTICDRMSAVVEEAKRTVRNGEKTLELANPENVLKRGFAIVMAEGGRIVRSPNEVEDGEVIGIKLSEGELAARIVVKK